MPAAKMLASFTNLFIVVPFLDGETLAVGGFELQDSLFLGKIKVGGIAENIFVVVETIEMSIVHDDENAVVGYSVEGDGIECHEGVFDTPVHRGAVGIKIDGKFRVSMAYAYRHVGIFFFTTVANVAVEVYLDAHNGVSGREQDGTVLFFDLYAEVTPFVLENGVLAYGQVEFEPFGMHVVGRCALLEVPNLLLTVGELVYRVMHFVAGVGIERIASREAYQRYR